MSKEGGIRLNKYLAHAGVASRRKSDELIQAGHVMVNGEVVREMGYKVLSIDNVTYKGQTLKIKRNYVYVLLNKPTDFITTTHDDRGRKTIMQLVSRATNERIYPIGRLDRKTSGLILLTNDGDLAQKLSHPSHEVKKVYKITLNKPLLTSDFDKIKKGVQLDDGLAKVDELAFPDNEDLRIVGMELHIGKNRIVRRIFEHLGYDVKKLDRTIYAGLTKKNLPRGKWRYLLPKEVVVLKHLNKQKHK